MSVALTISVSTNNCDSLIFSETTGAYSASNTGGWGSPNEAVGDAVSESLVITNPGGNEYTIDLTGGDFPTTDSSIEYTILASEIGLGTALTDGKYILTYSVITGEATYTTTVAYFVVCNVECCVNRLLLNIGDIGCDCSKAAKDIWLKAYTLLIGLQHNAVCGDEETFDSTLSTLQKICLNSNCKTCK